MPETRECNLCRCVFPRTPEFWHRDRKGDGGLGQTCKQCARDRSRKWHRENLERHKQSKREYDSRTRFPGSRKAEYTAAREKILDYQRRYYEQHGEKVKQRQREYAAANRQKIAESKRIAHIENREADNARYREWMAANPEKVKACTARNRARRRGAFGRVTEADVVAQYDKQRGTCFYCAHSLAKSFQIDHYMPLSRGGTNEPSNIVLACPACNRAKGAKLPGDFKPPKE